MTLVNVVCYKLNDQGFFVHDNIQGNVDLKDVDLKDLKGFDELQEVVLKALGISLNTPLWPSRQGVAVQPADVDGIKVK